MELTRLRRDRQTDSKRKKNTKNLKRKPNNIFKWERERERERVRQTNRQTARQTKKLVKI